MNEKVKTIVPLELVNTLAKIDGEIADLMARRAAEVGTFERQLAEARELAVSARKSWLAAVDAVDAAHGVFAQKAIETTEKVFVVERDLSRVSLSFERQANELRLKRGDAIRHAADAVQMTREEADRIDALDREVEDARRELVEAQAELARLRLESNLDGLQQAAEARQREFNQREREYNARGAVPPAVPSIWSPEKIGIRAQYQAETRAMFQALLVASRAASDAAFAGSMAKTQFEQLPIHACIAELRKRVVDSQKAAFEARQTAEKNLAERRGVIFEL